MNFQPKSFSNFLVKYRFIIIPLIPFLFFVAVLAPLFIPTSDNKISDNKPTPTGSADNSSNTFLAPDLVKDLHEAELEKPLNSFAGFQKTESLPDGTNKHTYSSPNPDRVNIIISKGEGVVLFQRNVTHPNFPVKITNYTNVYGPVKWIFKGSNFYGPNAQTYIYPDLGIAFIAKPANEEVLEHHVFLPMKVEDYVKNYGEDIPSYP